MVQKIKITKECQYQIIDLMLMCEKQGEQPIDAIEVVDRIVLEVGGETLSEGNSDGWITIENIRLWESDEELFLDPDKWLDDKHVMCAQLLIKRQFPKIGGLQSTLLQQKKIIPLPKKSLQIVHLPEHWISVSMMNTKNDDIVLYDSSSLGVDENTKLLLSKMVCTKNLKFRVRVANLTKQSGNLACGLYAIAYITHLAFGLDPSLLVFKQGSLRSHFVECIEHQIISPFPILREHRQLAIGNIITVEVHCYCQCPG